MNDRQPALHVLEQSASVKNEIPVIGELPSSAPLFGSCAVTKFSSASVALVRLPILQQNETPGK